MVTLVCTPPCTANVAVVIPPNAPPVYVPDSGENATDEDMVPTNVANNATPGVWTEFLPADANREGASIQNKDAAAIVYIVKSATQPANGTAPGETGIPVFPGYFRLEATPKARYWMRSTVASSVVSRNVW